MPQIHKVSPFGHPIFAAFAKTPFTQPVAQTDGVAELSWASTRPRAAIIIAATTCFNIMISVYNTEIA